MTHKGGDVDKALKLRAEAAGYTVIETAGGDAGCTIQTEADDVTGRYVAVPAGVLDEAVESLRRQRLLQETNRAFEALRSDPKAWQAELMERRQWEATLGDDLKD